MTKARAAAKAEAYTITTRRRLVRRLVIEGIPDGEIVRLLMEGIAGPDAKVIRVSEATARRDLDAISAEFSALFTSEDAMMREVYVGFDRYKRIAEKAMTGARPNYHAAIAATDRVIRIASASLPHFRHLAGPGARPPEGSLPPSTSEDEVLARAQELEHLDDVGLQRQHARLVERVKALGLTVVEGGAASQGRNAG